jgi:uncharacterized protein YqeY
MTFTEKINNEIKTAMLARNEAELRGLRAIKAALLLSATSGGSGEVSDEDAVKIIQKLAKQRKESLDIFRKQGREDLAAKEVEELNVLERFLPRQMSDEEISAALQTMLSENNISSAADFSKAMPLAMKKLAGKTDGKKISEILKTLLK